MFDGIIVFFSHFQEKDWVTSSFALVAFLTSAFTLYRSHRNHQQTLLKEQAIFEVSWIGPSDQVGNWGVLVARNVGTAWAYDVGAFLSADPSKLLGLHETAAGPLKPGQALRAALSRSARLLESSVPAMKDVRVVVEWTDQFGVRRRQETLHDRIAQTFIGKELPEAWNAAPEGFEFYSGGEIGFTEHFDRRLTVHGFQWRRRGSRRPDAS